MNSKTVILVALVLSLFWTPKVSAQASDDGRIPPSLAPWVPWVMDEIGDTACTQVNGSAACIWPSQLNIELGDSGGKFEQRVASDARAYHVLPGGEGCWPQAVEVDGRRLPVLKREGYPQVELSPGMHVIQGTFSWDRVPETLHIGHHTALLSLKIANKAVPLVKRDEGSVWLKGLSFEAGASALPEQVELQVYRQLHDGIPMRIETVIVFQVSGGARELSLPAPLIRGTMPLSVEGDLAVALESGGALRVQLVPGRHQITLWARVQGMPELLSSQKRGDPWPATEVWTWNPNTELRTVEISGAPGIDASRTNLPKEWPLYSAFLVGSDDVLKLTTTRRGEQQLPSNRIQIQREFWLDESAEQFTVRDTLSGVLHKRWRLDLLSGELGEVSLGGERQVITLSPDEHKNARGVEVRDARLSLVAVSRVPRTTQLSAVGWSEDVDKLSATLRLPPGWQLFAASGVDDTSNTWLSRWDLFSVFYVLVLTLGVARLVGRLAGAIAAIALILAHGESGSPEYIWLPLLIFSALVVVVESGRFQKFLRVSFYCTALVLLLTFVDFAVSQIRSALYPQLDASFPDDFALPASGEPLDLEPAPTDVAEDSQQSTEVKAELSKSSPAPEIEKLEIAQEVAAGMATRKVVIASKMAPGASSDSDNKLTRSGGGAGPEGMSSAYGSYDVESQKKFKSDAVVQTGPGIPQVSGGTWQLNWSGPVVREHKLAIYLISPGTQRLLTALRLVFLGILGWFLWRRVHTRAVPSQTTLGSGGSAMLGVLVFIVLALIPQSVRADEPSDLRLSELKERLLKPPSCEPACVSTSLLMVELADELIAVAQVHAAANVAYKLVGPASLFSQVSLLVDAKPAMAVRLEQDGSYYVRLEKGVHEVRLRAQLVGERLNLDVGSEPQYVHVEAKGWTVSGVNDLGRVEGGTLSLQRDVSAFKVQEGAYSAEPVKREIAVSPFFIVTRSVSLFVTGQVTTRIERLGSAASPEMLELPLLPGEQLTTPGIDVHDGIATVPFPRESSFKLLNSSLTLPTTATFSLTMSAKTQDIVTEIWELQCGVVWNCGVQGLAATSHERAGHSSWLFHPWPGEKLELTAIAPEAAQGTSLTVQNATLILNPGIRLARGELTMLVSTSRDVVHTVTIPPEAKLESVEVDGITQAVKSEGGQARISLTAGLRQVIVRWQQNQGISSMYRSPQVSAGASGVNFKTVLDLPEKRWLLLSGGPQSGPAILLWGYLVLILGAAVLLPRLPFSPLKSWQWILLGLGLTQIPSGVALLVAGWFFALGSRRSWPQLSRRRHNFLQLSLIGYTLTFLFVLTVAVYDGLVSSPDMEVSGAGSYASHLVWHSDRAAGHFAPIWCVSLSIWVWRVFMLVWALWLSKSLIGWLKWAWLEMCTGEFWVQKPPKTAAKINPIATTQTEPRDEGGNLTT